MKYDPRRLEIPCIYHENCVWYHSQNVVNHNDFSFHCRTIQQMGFGRGLFPAKITDRELFREADV